MREILFKAKTCNGEWVEGLLAHKDNKWYISNKAGQPFAFEVRPDTICQYTGLTDKNGNKIWEYDVVEVTYRDSRFAENYTEIGFIKYFNSSARYRYVFKEEAWNFDCSTEIEVIGNIFDNPELIGGEDNE